MHSITSQLRFDMSSQPSQENGAELFVHGQSVQRWGSGSRVSTLGGAASAWCC